jgi:thiol-disulfide isomerase/thioredoxin/Tfp pilus assembly protein PilF
MGMAWGVAVLASCLPVFVAAQTGQAGSAAVGPAVVDPAVKEQLELGQRAIKAGKYKDAIEALNKADKLSNDACGECHLLLAVAYYHSGKLIECEANCDKAIALASGEPARAAAHNLKGNAAYAVAGADKNKMKASESEFRAAIQLDPKAAIYHMSLAKALLREAKDDDAKQELQACLALNPNEEMSREARLILADPRRGREEFAPEFEISTLQGERVSLKQLAGRIVVMDFWATWCEPCRASLPELKELTKKYPADKLILISVSADKEDAVWRDFVAKKKMDWAQYRDADHKILDAFGVHSFPTYLVIDGDGIIKERFTGFNPEETMVHRLKATLGQMPQLEGEKHK